MPCPRSIARPLIVAVALCTQAPGCAGKHPAPTTSSSSPPTASQPTPTTAGAAAETADPEASDAEARPGEGSCVEQHDRLVKALRGGAIKAAGSRAAVVDDLASLGATVAALRRSGDKPAGCAKLAAKVLHAAAGVWFTAAHGAAAGPARRALHGELARIYAIYLRCFLAAADGAKLAFFRAELLFRMGRWRRAAEAYEAICEMKLPPGAEAQRQKAALGAVVAWRKLYRPPGDRSQGKPAPLPEIARRRVAAIDRYVGITPTTSAVDHLYNKARLLLAHQHHAAAERVLSRILTKHPGHRLAQSSATLLLDSLNRRREHDRMSGWVDRMLRMPLLARGELKVTLDKLSFAIAYKAAEQLGSQGRFKECGATFARLAKRHRDSPRRPELLYSAGVCMERAGQHARALGQRRLLVERHGGHPLAVKVLAHLCGDPRVRRKGFWRRRCAGH